MFDEMTDNATQYIKEIDLKEAYVALRTDGIALVKLKKDTVLDVPLQIRLLVAYKELVGDKLTPFIFEAEEGVTITKEARDNATQLEEESPCMASAVVVQNIAYAMIANFYMKFNKPKRPYKVFNNKQEAIDWLKLFL
jgi:hypothetical protein